MRTRIKFFLRYVFISFALVLTGVGVARSPWWVQLAFGCCLICFACWKLAGLKVER